MHEGEAVSDVPVTSIDTSDGSELSASTRAVATADGGFGLKWLVELRPTRALMVEQFSSEHYVVCVVGILLSITGAMVINAMSASRVMPNKAGGLAAARGQVTDEDLLEPANRKR